MPNVREVPYDPDDLGMDLERARSLPVCMACRKSSDGAIKCVDGTVFCGTHYDRYLREGLKEGPAGFAKRLRETEYARCWAARLEE